MDDGIVLVLDPGHASNSTGASGGGLSEHVVTLELANDIRDYLKENYPQITVYLTREDDKCLSTDLVEDLELRAQFALEHDADFMVSLHFNASPDHDRRGAEAYYSRVASVSEQGKELAGEILERLTALGLADRGVQTRASSDHFDENGYALDYYAVIRHSAARGIPCIIVEHCFIDNEADRKYMQDEAAVRALAKADAEGIAAYFGLMK